jgi:hypothetical protein
MIDEAIEINPTAQNEDKRVKLKNVSQKRLF